MEYKLVICGGTFDRLHSGHKAFLLYAFEKGEHVLIGLTSDAYVTKVKKNADIFPFEKRLEELKEFLNTKGLLERAKIVAIDSRFDETQIEEHTGAALLVSEETKNAGEEINKEREKQGFAPLPLLIFPLIAGNNEERISSSKIRDGIMTREGVMLPDRSFLARTLYIPDSLRETLHKPFGMLFTRDIPKQFLKNPTKLVTVGDVITKRINKLGVFPKIAVIDFFVERHKTNESLTQLGFTGKEKMIHIINPAGQLSPTLWKKLLHVHTFLQQAKNTVIIIEGEEDLLVIPLILTLPLGFIIMYGQPKMSEEGEKEGVVILEITEELKKQTYRLLKLFVHN